jgi:hypothetical protein
MRPEATRLLRICKRQEKKTVVAAAKELLCRPLSLCFFVFFCFFFARVFFVFLRPRCGGAIRVSICTSVLAKQVK